MATFVSLATCHPVTSTRRGLIYRDSLSVLSRNLRAPRSPRIPARPQLQVLHGCRASSPDDGPLRSLLGRCSSVHLMSPGFHAGEPGAGFCWYLQKDGPQPGRPEPVPVCQPKPSGSIKHLVLTHLRRFLMLGPARRGRRGLQLPG